MAEHTCDRRQSTMRSSVEVLLDTAVRSTESTSSAMEQIRGETAMIRAKVAHAKMEALLTTAVKGMAR